MQYIYVLQTPNTKIMLPLFPTAFRVVFLKGIYTKKIRFMANFETEAMHYALNDRCCGARAIISLENVSI